MGGKNVKTCLQLIKDYTADMTPEWAEEITSVPADTIRRIANELVDHALIGSTIELDGETFPFRPAGVLAPGRGSNSNPLNVELFKAIEVVNELLGCIDVPGGILGLEHGDLHVMDTDDDGMLLPPASDNFRNQAVGQEKLSFPPKSYKLECFYPHELHVMQLVWRAALDPESYYLDYKPEVYMVLGGGNPLRSNSNPEAVVEVLKQIPFTFTISLWMDEMTQFADVVLPVSTSLEHEGIVTFHGCNQPGQFHALTKVLEPLGECKSDLEIMLDLDHRINPDRTEDAEKWSNEHAYLDAKIQSIPYTENPETGEAMTYETLKEWVYGRYEIPYYQYELGLLRADGKPGFKSPTGRVELWSTVKQHLGEDPLPYYEEPFESPISTPDVAEAFPLILTAGSRVMPYYHSEYRQVNGCRDRYPEPHFQIHPETAANLGIGDGMWCWIETRRGRCLQKAKLDAGMSPYTISAQHGWWYPELPEEEPWLGGWFMSNINMCTDNDPDNCCRLSGVYNVKLAQCNVHRADDVPFRSLFG